MAVKDNLRRSWDLTLDSFRVLISTSSSSMFPSEWNNSLRILSSMAFNWFLSEFIRTISWFLWSSRSGLSRRTTSLQCQRKKKQLALTLSAVSFKICMFQNDLFYKQTTQISTNERLKLTLSLRWNYHLITVQTSKNSVILHERRSSGY